MGRSAAMHAIEVHRLQFGRDGATCAFADGPIVKFADRRDLGGSAGEERLVGAVDLVASDAFFDHRQANFTGQLNDGVAGDAFECAGQVGRVEFAVASASLCARIEFM